MQNWSPKPSTRAKQEQPPKVPANVMRRPVEVRRLPIHPDAIRTQIELGMIDPEEIIARDGELPEGVDHPVNGQVVTEIASKIEVERNGNELAAKPGPIREISRRVVFPD